MPEPGKGESQKDFVSRCIPVVMDEGTAKDNKQAAAICFSMWRQAQKQKSVSMPMLMTKAERLADGRIRWQAKANTGDFDKQQERFDESFFDDIVANFWRVSEAISKGVTPPDGLPVPVLDISHYSFFLPSERRNDGRTGWPVKLWRDGKALMAQGYFDATPLGQLAAKAAMSREPEDRRISIAVFPDWENVVTSESGRVFRGGRGVAYLDSLAMTAHPVDPGTEIEVMEVKSMTTLADDAKRVLGEEGSEIVDALEASRIAKSTGIPGGVLIKDETTTESATAGKEAEVETEKPTQEAETPDAEATPEPETEAEATPSLTMADLQEVMKAFVPQLTEAFNGQLKPLQARVDKLAQEVTALKTTEMQKVKAALDSPSGDWLTELIKASVQRSTGPVKDQKAEPPGQQVPDIWSAISGRPT